MANIEDKKVQIEVIVNLHHGRRDFVSGGSVRAGFNCMNERNDDMKLC